MLVEHGGKTIVFVQPRATVRHLFRHLRGHRVAAVMGDRGWFGRERATRADVLRAFAPVAQGAPGPAAALQTDVLLATDLLSEGLNLQDAVRVIHYDVPWSPARLAQRVGRIDRAGSPHAHIETVTFLPPPSLAGALAIERRWLPAGAARPRRARAGDPPGGAAGARPTRRDRAGPVARRRPRPAHPAAHPLGAHGRPPRGRAGTPRRARPPRCTRVAARARDDGRGGGAARRATGAPRTADGAGRAGVA